MPNLIRTMFLQSTGLMYRLIRPIIFMRPTQQTHTAMLTTMSNLDNNTAAQFALEAANRLAFSRWPIEVGGVLLPHPFILGAGFVSGHGFNDEAESLKAVKAGINILPGWRTMPSLVGPVEFGSFTRHPRRGNFGTVVWRHNTQSTQNRIGFRNPGALAAARFLSLSKVKPHLSKVYGINIAASPDAQTIDQRKEEILESIDIFLNHGVYPSWFTVNIDTASLEDDVNISAIQDTCAAAINHLRQKASAIGREIPLWAKISPGLNEVQYTAILCALELAGVRAVIATNTLPHPAPGYKNLESGLGGGRLHPHAVRAIQILAHEKQTNGYKLDLIGSGGVQDPVSYHAFNRYKVIVVQYWSILIYRGPLAAARILNDIYDILADKYKDK